LLDGTRVEPAYNTLPEYEPLPGDHIGQACRSLLAIAPAFMIFNGIRVEAQTGVTIAYLIGKYQSLRAARADRVDEKQTWTDTAVEANRRLDAYLRELCPTLPKEYGMPVDGVRQAYSLMTEQLFKLGEQINALKRHYNDAIARGNALEAELGGIREALGRAAFDKLTKRK
jgi:hypothetical protein